jgi:hypothetical protein
MKNSNKVQCISTKSGFHEHLKLGAWYEAKEHNGRFSLCKNMIIIEHHYLNKHGVYVTTEGIYDKSLFRTVSERRDNKLDKILG